MVELLIIEFKIKNNNKAFNNHKIIKLDNLFNLNKKLH